MEKFVFETEANMGLEAAAATGTTIKAAIKDKGYANIILATGASQFEMLTNLVKYKGIDWSKVTMFHLDEYVGLSEAHRASFKKYLKERFVNQVGNLKAVIFVKGDVENPPLECDRLSKLINEHPIDVACVGIGENGHLAFNDPPADFDIEDAYIIVNLDEKCRRQQVNEGWFTTIEEVPSQAISMTIKQIMKSKCIIVTVPGERKALAVKNTLEQTVSPMYPASILRNHSNCKLYLDKTAASLVL